MDHFFLFMFRVCYAFLFVHCNLVVTCWERTNLLALMFDVLLCFCHLPVWCPVSGMVLYCIDF